MNNYKCGHCHCENVMLKNCDDAIIEGLDLDKNVIFTFLCPNCKFTVEIPIPIDVANSSDFNAERELLDIWESQSKKAIKLT